MVFKKSNSSPRHCNAKHYYAKTQLTYILFRWYRRKKDLSESDRQEENVHKKKIDIFSLNEYYMMGDNDAKNTKTVVNVIHQHQYLII